MTIKKIKKSTSKGGVNVSAEIIDIDKGWNELTKQVKKLKKSYTGVGYFFSPGTPEESLSARAIVNEFGAKIKVTKKMKGFFAWKFKVFLKKKFIIIPERAFMRQTYDQNKSKINGRIKDLYNQLMEGKLSAKQLLSQLGEWYKSKIQLQITNGNFVENSGLTKTTKGSSQPLIDTGEMRNGVQHREFMK
jgi:hypothetical protein